MGRLLACVAVLLFAEIAFAQPVQPHISDIGFDWYPANHQAVYASGMSSKGEVVVGMWATCGLYCRRAIRWVGGDGIDLGGALNGDYAEARGVSGDGMVIAGMRAIAPPSGTGDWSGFTWTPLEGFVSLPALPGYPVSLVADISRDGTTVVGNATGIDIRERPVRWVNGGPPLALALPPDTFSAHAAAVNADGSVIVGTAIIGTGPESYAVAVRWTDGGTSVQLLGHTPACPEWLDDRTDPLPHPSRSTACSVSDDGDVVVGLANELPFRWTPNGGIQQIPLPQPYCPHYSPEFSPLESGICVSGDGFTIAGVGYPAFIHTAEHGSVDLLAYFQSRGIDMAGWSVLAGVSAISQDGTVMAGFGVRTGTTAAAAWYVDLNSDMDGDGLLDDWEMNGIPYKDAAGQPARYVLPGANPRRKDIYVEVDAMPGRMIPTAAANAVIDAFDVAPVPAVAGVPGEPLPGIALHIIRDEVDIPSRSYVGSVWTSFHQDKAQKFGTEQERTAVPADWPAIREAKAKAYRYCICCGQITPNIVGIAECDNSAPGAGPRRGGNDFIIGFGPLPVDERTIATQAGVFMHELGHTLGLFHGGFDPVQLYNPNHFSVMNYMWMAERKFGVNATRVVHLSYSKGNLKPLNEASLDEDDENCIGGDDPNIQVPIIVGKPGVNNPFGCNEHPSPDGRCDADARDDPQHWCIRFVPMSGKVDWNNDNLYTGVVCGNPNDHSGVINGEVMTDVNEWALLAYNFRDSPFYSNAVYPVDSSPHPTVEMELFLRSISCPPAPCPASAPIAGVPAPATASACLAGTLSFTVAPQGAGPWDLRWRRFDPSQSPPWTDLADGVMTNGTVIAGARKFTLTITGANVEDFGGVDARLSCRAMDTCGQIAESGECVVLFGAPAVSITSPYEATTCPGGTASFSVASSGAGPFTYQWTRIGPDSGPLANGIMPGGTVVAGADGPVLSLSNVNEDSLGSTYVELACIVSDPCGNQASSESVYLSIGGAWIGDQPEDVDRPCTGGATASFTVSVFGDPPYQFQWYRDGNPLTNGPRISGADAATIFIANPVAADAGLYTCEVTNACGGDTSGSGRLNIGPPRAIYDTPYSFGACLGGTMVNEVQCLGTPPFTYQWMLNGIDLEDGPRISGAQSSEITISDFQPGDVGTYTVRIHNDCGETVSPPAVGELIVPPGIASHPSDRIICPTGTTVVSVVPDAASQDAYFNWQVEYPGVPGYWIFINQDTFPVIANSCASLSGYASANLTIVWSGDGLCGSTHRFRCMVSRGCASTPSNAATVTLCPADFNCSGSLAVQDIFDFLAAWFAGSPQADVNGGGLSVQDIFAYLNLWFAGC